MRSRVRHGVVGDMPTLIDLDVGEINVEIGSAKRVICQVASTVLVRVFGPVFCASTRVFSEEVVAIGVGLRWYCRRRPRDVGSGIALKRQVEEVDCPCSEEEQQQTVVLPGHDGESGSRAQVVVSG